MHWAVCRVLLPGTQAAHQSQQQDAPDVGRSRWCPTLQGCFAFSLAFINALEDIMKACQQMMMAF